jgi:hypothetical protein
MVTRTVPVKVLNILREEVGYHCPADKNGEICGSPYLTWHHFDPPWKQEKHHRPEGMIALCREHADKADNKSYTDDQLRLLKSTGSGRGLEVSGRFDWMRREMVALVGGNAYFGVDLLICMGTDPVVWFSTNGNGERMINFKMPTQPGVPQRAAMIDNFWRVDPKDASVFVCPPSGRTLKVVYANGDYFKCEFDDIEDANALKKALPKLPYINSYAFQFPFTLVRLDQEAAGTSLKLRSSSMNTGMMDIADCVMKESTIMITVK